MPNFNRLIALRIDKQNRELLKEVCDLRGEGISSFVRRAIFKELAQLGFLDETQKQALGLSQTAEKSEMEIRRTEVS